MLIWKATSTDPDWTTPAPSSSAILRGMAKAKSKTKRYRVSLSAPAATWQSPQSAFEFGGAMVEDKGLHYFCAAHAVAQVRDVPTTVPELLLHVSHLDSATSTSVEISTFPIRNPLWTK
jgi:hypothetical protein